MEILHTLVRKYLSKSERKRESSFITEVNIDIGNKLGIVLLSMQPLMAEQIPFSFFTFSFVSLPHF